MLLNVVIKGLDILVHARIKCPVLIIKAISAVWTSCASC